MIGGHASQKKMDDRVEGGWRSATFDSTGSNIVVAGDNGFQVVSSLDGHVILSNEPDVLGGPCSGPVSQCGASNLFVISTSEPTHTCKLFDDSRRRVIGELGPFFVSRPSCPERPVGLRWVEGAGVIVVQLEAGKVLVYDVLDDLRLVWRGACAGPAAIGTLAAVNVDGTARVAYAGRQRGSVVVVEDPRTASLDKADPSVGTTAVRAPHDNSQATIMAHNHDIAVVALSPDGCKLATASSNGTIIRIFRVTAGSDESALAPSLEMELRRSSSSTARMHSLAFSFDSPSSLLACASDTGTLHVFRLTGRSPYPSISPRRSKWRYVLPGKDRCALAFHFRSPLLRPLLTVVSHSGAWQIGLLLEEDGAITLLTHLTHHLRPHNERDSPVGGPA